MVAVVQACEWYGEGWRAEVICHNRALRGSAIEVLSPRHPVRACELSGLELLDANGACAPAEDLIRNGARYRLLVPWELEAHDVLCV